jgi:hypothetical protein
MTGHEQDPLMDQRAGARGDDARRDAQVVRLHKVDERPDIREEVQDVDDPDCVQAVRVILTCA